MISFDLRCGGDHVFEAWFRSSRDHDAQAATGLIACPLCGDTRVAKALMAPNVAGKGNRMPAIAAPRAPTGSAPTDRAIVNDASKLTMAAGKVPALPPAMQAMFSAIVAAQAKALPQSTWVGDRFAAEARAIHASGAEASDDAPTPMIHGRATIDEAEALIADGIGVMPLLVPIIPPEQRN